jgi:hypothetical protein
VVGCDGFDPQPLRQVMAHPFHQLSGVHKDDRGPDLPGIGRNAVVHLPPHGMTGDGPEGSIGDLDREIQVAILPDVHDGAIRRSVGFQIPGTDEQPPDLLDRPLRGAQANSLKGHARQVIQAFQGQGQMGTALVVGHGMDLIHNDRLRREQKLSAPLCGQQDVEGLRRGD